MAGTTLGGLATALGLWVLSGLAAPLPAAARLTLFALTSAAALLVAHGIVPGRLPQNRRQIPRTVFDRAPARAAARFGVELGTGLRTYLPSAAPHVLALGLVLLGGPWWAALALGAGFGAGRGLLPTQRALSPDPRRWDARVELAGPVLRGAGETIAVVGLLVAVAVAG